MTDSELRARAVDQLRRLRLEEKRLRVAALGYDAGELDVADLQMAVLSYAAEVRVYREIERALLELGVRIPKEVRVGSAFGMGWELIEDAEVTEPCRYRHGKTLQ